MRFFSYFLALSFLLPTISAAANTTPKQVDMQSLSLQKSYLQTIDCRSPKRLAGMISTALKSADDYTTKASNAVVFEEIMINNPSCFIQALNNLPPKQCSEVENTFIKETFFYPRNDIKSALMSATNYTKSCIAS
jgi:hypothetical protein